jgi:thioester reductase-like protein
VLLTGATGWVGAHLLRELLASTEAKVVCLVRNRDRRAAHDALLDNLRDRGMEVEDSWAERVVPLIGDLTRPQLGLGPNEWRGLSEEVDLVYHWAASVNVLWDYATHRAMNVHPLTTLVELAAAHHVKPILFGSPMTVCRRLLDGTLTVLTEEAVHDDPRGLLTGYAQSKWVGEHVLTAAAKRGVPVKIYRTSHALPSSKTGLAKNGDTYGAILGVACRAAAIPEWRDSAIQGLPVDTYCRLIVTDSLLQDGFQGVIHLENPAPPSLDRVMEALLGEKLQGRPVPRISLREWAERCRQVADQVPGEAGSLGKLLFTERDAGTAVEAMFARHAHQARRIEETGRGAALADATPPAYWQRVWQTSQW